MYIEVYKLVSQVQTFTLRVTAKEDLFIYLIVILRRIQASRSQHVILQGIQYR